MLRGWWGVVGELLCSLEHFSFSDAHHGEGMMKRRDVEERVVVWSGALFFFRF